MTRTIARAALVASVGLAAPLVAQVPTEVPPVVPEMWAGATPAADAPFTTIANWGAYGGVTHDGQHYGQKDEEFLRLKDEAGL